MTVDRSYDEFPVGMEVLAVDDDPICLKLLETLLRKCRYHVTTTSQAIGALNLLREDKDKFDLVISDVHMPDMDGFKLLEFVGLEMDLPVIMLSANGDTKLVMKGITHGACDYLLKPVRIEELKNIWQHVVRRKKKVHPTETNNYDQHCYNENEGRQLHGRTGDSDQNYKLNRKRKDQKEDDDEDHDNGLNTEDSSTQKKARLVWTADLHRKFVAAVRTLGVDKAVPKKILDMMNVEKLTRENVASHLQKYRKYLNRISCGASLQANMVAALGSPDAAYLRMASLSGYGNIPNTAVRPFISTGLLGSRLNPASGLPIHALPSSGTIQIGHSQNFNNPSKAVPKFQQVMIPGNQNGNIVERPTSLEFDQLQRSSYTEQPLSIPSAKTLGLPISSNVNQSCMEFPSDLPDFGGSSDSWSAGQPDPFTLRDVLRTTLQGERGIIFTTSANSFTIPSVNEASDLIADFTPNLRDAGNSLGAYQSPNFVCNSVNSMFPSNGILGSSTQYNESSDNINTGYSRNYDFNVVEMQCLGNSQIMQQTKLEQSGPNMKQGYLMGQINPLGDDSYSNSGLLEDLVSAMIKLDQDVAM